MVRVMRYILTTRCRVEPGKMETFLRDVQQWEEIALASPEAPLYHAVYLNRAEPSEALIITQFDSKERADAFAATKLLDNFHDKILSCVVESTDAEGYDLYYAAGAGGPRVVFGEDG
jgi:quinol monooxygenase YgiN